MKDDEYAGFWIRVGANLIDLIILIILYASALWILMLLFGDFFSDGHIDGISACLQPSFCQ